MVQLRILGASGGIGDGVHTTSFLLDQHTLLDGGTGVGRLTIEEMCQVDRLLLTHAHMDHISGFSLMLATVIGRRRKPIQLIAPADVLAVLDQHLFNWALWPDFRQLPNAQEPVLEFCSLEPGKQYPLTSELSVEAIPLSHTVPSYAYLIRSGKGSICFCGDTASTERLWQRINQSGGVDRLFIELSYPESEAEVARVAGHYCPSTLYADLKQLQQPGQICLMHPKPGKVEQIQREVRAHAMAAEFELLFVNEQLVIDLF